MKMGQLLAAFGAGVLFAAGLVVSQMINPAKVLGFLDIAGARTGRWDPSLIFVMATAIPFAALGQRLAQHVNRPLTAPAFAPPARRDIDLSLIAGAVLFGAGWGLVGYCPGPALAALDNGSYGTAIFVAAMLAGMGLFTVLRR